VPGSAAPAALGERRRVRPRRRSARAATRARRSRAVDVPGARRRGQAVRLPPRGPLDHGQHPEGPPARRRALRGPSGAPPDPRPRAYLTQKAGVRPVPFGHRLRWTGIESLLMSVDSPNLEGLDSWAFEPRKVDKPWGHELIWAEGDRYVGKVLFVKAGESLSLQFHRVKEESWLVQAGRAKLELGSAGDAMLKQEVIAAGACFHFRPGTVHRVTAIDDTTIVEVSTPELDDVVRLEDRYGREGTSKA